MRVRPAAACAGRTPGGALRRRGAGASGPHQGRAPPGARQGLRPPAPAPLPGRSPPGGRGPDPLPGLRPRRALAGGPAEHAGAASGAAPGPPPGSAPAAALRGVPDPRGDPAHAPPELLRRLPAPPSLRPLHPDQAGLGPGHGQGDSPGGGADGAGGHPGLRLAVAGPGLVVAVGGAGPDALRGGPGEPGPGADRAPVLHPAPAPRRETCGSAWRAWPRSPARRCGGCS